MRREQWGEEVVNYMNTLNQAWPELAIGSKVAKLTKVANVGVFSTPSSLRPDHASSSSSGWPQTAQIMRPLQMREAAAGPVRSVTK